MAGSRVRAPLVLKLAILGALGWGGWALTGGSEGSRKLKVLDAEVRLLHHRIEVLKYLDEKGSLPEFLDDTMTLRGASPVSEWNRYSRERGRQCVDPWNESLGWERDPGGAGFEIRSAGPDGKMRTPDDIALRGGAADDRKAAYDEFKAKSDEYERLRPKSRRKRPY